MNINEYNIESEQMNVKTPHSYTDTLKRQSTHCNRNILRKTSLRRVFWRNIVRIETNPRQWYRRFDEILLVSFSLSGYKDVKRKIHQRENIENLCMCHYWSCVNYMAYFLLIKYCIFLKDIRNSGTLDLQCSTRCSNTKNTQADVE